MMRIGRELKIAKMTKQRGRGNKSMVPNTDQDDESELPTYPLNGHSLYVGSMTYPDLCNSSTSLTLIQPLTSLVAGSSLEITANGDISTVPDVLIEATCNLEKEKIQRSARTLDVTSGGYTKDIFGMHTRRDL